jgi:phage-related protein
MALGFTTSATYGTRQVLPDRGLSSQTQPKVLVAKFGDGYEQRVADGINSLQQSFSISFNNRTKEEVDDITGYLGSLKGATAFSLTIPDSNNGGERTIKVVCDNYSQMYMYDNFYSASASLRRVYEP